MSRGKQRGASSRRSLSAEEGSPAPNRGDEELNLPEDFGLEEPELDDANPIDPSILEDGGDGAIVQAEIATEGTTGEPNASGLPLGGPVVVGQRRVAPPNPICAAAYEASEGAAATEDRKLYEAFVARQSKSIQQLRNKQGQAPYNEKRGKVHWDHLLEEMEWLAKDFTR